MPATTPRTIMNAIGREGEQLRQPQARQAVEPARRRDAERALEHLVDESGTAEQQDQAEPDDERRGDQRQQRERVQRPLQARAATLGEQRDHRAEQGRAGRRQQREEQRVPGHAAARTRATQASPRCAGGDALDQRGQRDVPGLVEEGAGERLDDRQRDEQQQQRAAQHAAAAVNRSPRK